MAAALSGQVRARRRAGARRSSSCGQGWGRQGGLPHGTPLPHRPPLRPREPLMPPNSWLYTVAPNSAPWNLPCPIAPLSAPQHPLLPHSLPLHPLRPTPLPCTPQHLADPCPHPLPHSCLMAPRSQPHRPPLPPSCPPAPSQPYGPPTDRALPLAVAFPGGDQQLQEVDIQDADVIWGGTHGHLGPPPRSCVCHPPPKTGGDTWGDTGDTEGTQGHPRDPGGGSGGGGTGTGGDRRDVGGCWGSVG